MSRPSGPNRYFPKVKEAREALAEKAKEIQEAYLALAKKAADAGDFKVASQMFQFLMEHMPQDPEGRTLIDPSVNQKQIESKGPTGPSIQIGIALGQPPTRPSLPESTPHVEVIDVTETKHEPDPA